MLESIRNIFSIPDLRKRVIFTLLLLAVYRIGCQIPNPGISAEALAEFLAEPAWFNSLVFMTFLRTGYVENDHFCSWHHALYQRLDHTPAADRGLAIS